MKTLKIEEVILGTCLLYPEHFFIAEQIVDTFHFTGKNALLWDAVRDDYYKNKIKPRPVLYELDNPEFDLNWLAALAEQSVTHKIDDWCYRLKREHQRGELDRSISSALEELRVTTEVDNLGNFLKREIDKILYDDKKTDSSVKSMFRSYVDKIYEMKDTKGLTGIDTGFAMLNKLLGGWQRTDQVVIAGRSGIGKTTVGANIGYNALKSGARVVFVTEEQDREQILHKFVCIEAGMTVGQIRTGNYTEGQAYKISSIVEQFADDKFFIVKKGRKLDLIINEIRRINIQFPVDLVIVDYIQLVKPMEKNLSSIEQIEICSAAFKLMASEEDVNCTSILLAQLNRESEKRASNKPRISDLKGSGALEQDADQILLLYREDYYDRAEGDKSLVIDIAKNRHGAVGFFECKYDLEKLTELQYHTDQRDFVPF